MERLRIRWSQWWFITLTCLGIAVTLATQWWHVGVLLAYCVLVVIGVWSVLARDEREQRFIPCVSLTTWILLAMGLLLLFGYLHGPFTTR